MPTPPWPKPPEPLFAALRLPHFPAQALAAENSSLHGRAFAVVEQNAESHKTPLLSVSKAARAQEVEAGMPAFLAARWHNLTLLPRNLAAEARMRGKMSALLLAYTPAFSIRADGSGLMDMTGTPSARKWPAETWSARLWQALSGLGLECVAVGAASSQAVAKVLARLIPENGARVCPPGAEESLLSPLSPTLLPGLSPHARELLGKYGLHTVEQLRRLEREELRLRFGNEAEKLHCLARGLDLEAVSPRNAPLAAETVLPRDLNDEAALRGQVRLTADKLGHALRAQGRTAARLTLALQYSDGRGLRRTAALRPATSAFAQLAETAERLFAGLHQRRVALRRIRCEVAAPGVETGQTDLFDPAGARKQEALALALDRIRRKKGFLAVLNADGLRMEPRRRKTRAGPFLY